MHAENMKISLFIVLVGLTSTLNASRNKRAAYDLPHGSELTVGGVRISFVCSSDGYYADQENNCKIFHVCQSVVNADGTSKMLQWSFFCGNQTIFNQFSLTCAHPEESIPCERATDFFHLNTYIGIPYYPSHFESDVGLADAILGRNTGRSSARGGSGAVSATGTGGHSGRPRPASDRPVLTVPVDE